jgi:hypothetical protein
MRGARSKPQMSKGQLEQGILALNTQVNMALQAVAADMMRLSAVLGGVCDHLGLIERTECACGFELLHPTVGEVPPPTACPKCRAPLGDDSEE